MLLNAEKIFDANAVEFSAAMGTPEDAAAFNEKYIQPAIAENTKKGIGMDCAFWLAGGSYQRSGFIAGFKAAVQLLLDCSTAGNTTKG